MYQWNGMSDAERRWNRFVDLACNVWDDTALNETQSNALQCLLYARRSTTAATDSIWTHS